MQVTRTKLTETREAEKLLLFLSVIQKLLKMLQMCESPYIWGSRNIAHKICTIPPKSGRLGSLSMLCQKCILWLGKKMGYLVSRTELDGTEICKICKSGTVPRKSGQMGFEIRSSNPQRNHYTVRDLLVHWHPCLAHTVHMQCSCSLTAVCRHRLWCRCRQLILNFLWKRFKKRHTLRPTNQEVCPTSSTGCPKQSFNR
jgi:hypothetical protein